MIISLSRYFLVLSLVCSVSSSAFAQDTQDQAPEEATPSLKPDALENSFLQDYNGDGELTIIAFGDSLTRGTGDFIAPNQFVESVQNPTVEAGYPLRAEMTLGVAVSNFGKPSEIADADGVFRFAQTVPPARPDVVIISEGANDSIFNTSPVTVNRDLQTMVNISYAIGAQPIIATISPACCDRAGRNPSIQAYNDQIRSIAASNSIPLSDTDRAFENTCGAPANCSLLNRPEGLHPNIDGYDVIGENVVATLLGIDLLSPDGPKQYENALNLSEGSVRTIPDAIEE